MIQVVAFVIGLFMIALMVGIGYVIHTVIKHFEMKITFDEVLVTFFGILLFVVLAWSLGSLVLDALGYI